MLTKLYLLIIINIRWAYFHMNPMYIKFYMDLERTEAHFQHRRTGLLYSNYVLMEKDSDN